MNRGKSGYQQHSPLIIRAFTDNKPGHRNQLEGLIQALDDMRPTEVMWTNVSNHLQGLSRLLSCRQYTTEPKPDILIGAGHQTHIQLLTAKYCLKTPAVVLMKPSFPLSWFDLCFIPRHDQPPVKDNIVATLGPINKIRPSTHQDNKHGLFLIGGVSRHFNWDNAEVIRQIKQLTAFYSSTQWQVVLSRRTPDTFIDKLRRILPELKVIQPAAVDKTWLPQQMQHCGIIWVTADSMSMLYEAITSSAEVGVMQLSVQQPNRISFEIDRLTADKVVSVISDSVVTPDKAANIDEAQRCAAILLKKLNL